MIVPITNVDGKRMIQGGDKRRHTKQGISDQRTQKAPKNSDGWNRLSRFICMLCR